jgi:hypothetical protein
MDGSRARWSTLTGGGLGGRAVEGTGRDTGRNEENDSGRLPSLIVLLDVRARGSLRGAGACSRNVIAGISAGADTGRLLSSGSKSNTISESKGINR